MNEGCQLTMAEVVSVLCLAGKQTLFGFQTEDIGNMSREDFWNACCRLMRDSMMTQINGKFRLHKDLMEVMQPVCQAKEAIVMTPGTDRYAQAVYYVADTVCSMERTSSGRCILRAMDRCEMAGDLEERMDLREPETLPAAEDLPPVIKVMAGDDRKTLLEGAVLVAERFDTETGTRTGWIRIVEEGVFSWLQWTDHDTICCGPLTGETLSGLLQTQG